MLKKKNNREVLKVLLDLSRYLSGQIPALAEARMWVLILNCYQTDCSLEGRPASVPSVSPQEEAEIQNTKLKRNQVST